MLTLPAIALGLVLSSQTTTSTDTVSGATYRALQAKHSQDLADYETMLTGCESRESALTWQILQVKPLLIPGPVQQVSGFSGLEVLGISVAVGLALAAIGFGVGVAAF